MERDDAAVAGGHGDFRHVLLPDPGSSVIRSDSRQGDPDMPTLDRRQFLKLAAAMGATLAWSCSTLRPSSSGWRERRELFPHGVASGDPDANSVLLWTRRPYDDGRERATLLVEVAQDPDFTRVIATTAAPVLAASDWTSRVLVGDLPSSRSHA